MPPKDAPVRRTAGSTCGEGQPRRPNTTRQLITFVDSQDPNSRSAIQRHTAHHANAQRRDARLQSLRSNRPRLLQWQRRPSADVDAVSVASPQSSTSSASASSGSRLRKPSSAPGEISTELSVVSIPVKDSAAASNKLSVPNSTPKLLPELLVTEVDDDELESHIGGVCPFVQREIYRDVLKTIQRSDIASRSLLLAYIRAIRAQHSNDPQAEADRNEAHRYYGQGTRLLRDRLTKPEMASSNENIQAVLLLIIYAYDAGSREEVSIHVDALTRMLFVRGGLECLNAETDPTLMFQLKGLAKSRWGHLTLACDSNCYDGLRFPNGLSLPGQVNSA